MKVRDEVGGGKHPHFESLLRRSCSIHPMYSFFFSSGHLGNLKASVRRDAANDIISFSSSCPQAWKRGSGQAGVTNCHAHDPRPRRGREPWLWDLCYTCCEVESKQSNPYIPLTFKALQDYHVVYLNGDKIWAIHRRNYLEFIWALEKNTWHLWKKGSRKDLKAQSFVQVFQHFNVINFACNKIRLYATPLLPCRHTIAGQSNASAFVLLC